MKILIVGSKGFIGGHCVTYFRDKGHEIWQVDTVSDSYPNYYQVNQTFTDYGAILQTTKFDICINASGSAHVSFSFDKPDIDFELNVLNVHKLLVALRRFNPSCKFVNFSSAAVYGNPQSLPINEDSSIGPLSPYGFHKLQSEYLLTEYHKFFGLRTCNLRVFSAYGPGLRKQLFWDLYTKLKLSSQVVLFGTGAETRDFIYVDDLVRALDLIIQNSTFTGESINLASGIETSIAEAAACFFSKFSSDVQVAFSGKEKQGDPINWKADISSLKACGYEPKVLIDEGLINYIEWLRTLR